MKRLISVVLKTMLPLLLLLACGGCGNRNDAMVKASTTTVPDVPEQLVRINTNLPALYLNRKEFLDIDSARYKDKLVLQLYHQKDSSLFSLALHPAGYRNIVFDEAKIKYPKPFANGLNFLAIDLFLGDQQTKNGELEKLTNEIRRYALIRYVIFTPKVDKDHHLYYEIMGVEKLPVSSTVGFRTTAYYSSPTPPAKLR